MQFYSPPHKHVGLSSLFPQPRCNTSFSVSCPLRSFLKITASALLLRERPGRWALSRILQREKSDDCSSDEWTVKHYLWFRGFFLKVQLRGSSQTSTTAAAPLPRRRFKWQSHADVRSGCCATKSRQKNKNNNTGWEDALIHRSRSTEACLLFSLRFLFLECQTLWNPDGG